MLVSTDKQFVIHANTEEVLKDTLNGHTLTTYVMYFYIKHRLRCHGYDGYNCNFKTLDDLKYKRDPGTKNVYCVKKEDCEGIYIKIFFRYSM